MLKLITETVDIYELPEVHEDSKDNTEITIGDLHGNSMKLIYMLVKHGICRDITTDDYEKLVNLYKKSELQSEDIKEFNRILDKVSFNPQIGVRLIGDELADRGSNDYFTLKILEKLSKHKVPVEILFSNHSLEFVEAYEKVADGKADSFASQRLYFGHAASSHALQSLVDKGLVDKFEVLAIVGNAYKPNVKAISYSVSDTAGEIVIYSHAAIGINTIKDLATKLDVEYEDVTINDLADTIDKINVQFQEHVENNTVHNLYTDDEIGGDSSNPVDIITWNRNYDKIERPSEQNDYKVKYVHGHDPKGVTNDYLTNLDNHLGKTIDLNQGKYTVQLATPNTIKFHAPIEQQTSNGEFEQLLEQIKQKRDEFKKLNKNPKYQEAYNAANTLYEAIMTEYRVLTNKREITNTDISTFKDKCKESIDSSRTILEKHRGWKQTLGHLAFAVIGLGIFYAIGLAAYKASGSKFSIFKTDSHKKIEDLEKGLNKYFK